MPLFYQHNINESTKLGIWFITEREDFFLTKVPLKRDVSHPQKRLQHLAGRFLLTELFADFPLEEILIADTNKPYLVDEKYHFSISHCGSYAAAIVSSANRVGVDVEKSGPTIEKIRHKFLSPSELERALAGVVDRGEQLRLLTLLWSAKESIFKWYSLGKVDFRDHIRWTAPFFIRPVSADQLSFTFRKQGSIPLTVCCKLFDDLILTFVYT
jgi:4'-phosphopantetheinyl transferase EntD